MTDIAERLRARNQRTVYINADTGESRDTPPAPDAPDPDAWFPFVIGRIDPEQVEQDGLLLAFAAHDLEVHAEEKLRAAQEDRKKFDAARPKDRQGKPSYQPPELSREGELERTYLARRGGRVSVLIAGMVDPRYADVQGALGKMERPLYTAIVNFGGVRTEGKAPSAS
ncbi:hypothetical protein QOL99_00160 [Deinococcus sp. MIMF12]|uniref:Single-stranded DNA-binding protein n=1 Tax=Deinococcus rhizophilus TaxID=3049544 RepID=A0ABT7JBY9_9DEIO|nr:hypothetical protein [Deinococcus rhizophilus]MDL2342561.1 hypothetical protein [Deinococcus rhizophilus]